jgi:hypothetical protein
VDEALLLRSLLEDCGIRSYVPEELTVTYLGQAGGIHLQVAEEDLEEAKKILAKAER